MLRYTGMAGILEEWLRVWDAEQHLGQISELSRLHPIGTSFLGLPGQRPITFSNRDAMAHGSGTRSVELGCSRRLPRL